MFKNLSTAFVSLEKWNTMESLDIKSAPYYWITRSISIFVVARALSKIARALSKKGDIMDIKYTWNKTILESV
mgnify:CR=1 FL=1